MLSSTLIVNALLVQSIFSGSVPNTHDVESFKEQEFQSITVSSEAQISASRDTVTITDAPVQTKTVLNSQVPLNSSNAALVASALKYVGAYWDCTMLVEQALRDLGYQVGDLGPMQFGQFGTVFNDPSQVQPGDIMMRGGHVAIWAGDGMSVQGGFGFNGVVYNSWEGPANYTAFLS